MTDDNRLWTVQELAAEFRVDETTVRRWIRDGLLEAVALPSKGRRTTYRITKQTIDRLKTAHLQTPDD